MQPWGNFETEAHPCFDESPWSMIEPGSGKKNCLNFQFDIKILLTKFFSGNICWSFVHRQSDIAAYKSVCVVQPFIPLLERPWSTCFIEKDNQFGLTSASEGCAVGDVIEQEVEVIMDCVSCFCAYGSFICKNITGSYYDIEEPCFVKSCDDGVVMKKPINEPCQCSPGNISFLLSNCTCVCLPAVTTLGTKSAVGDEGTSSEPTSTKDSDIDSYPAGTCSPVSVNLTLTTEELTALACPRDGNVTLPVRVCQGACDSASFSFHLQKTEESKRIFIAHESNNFCYCCHGSDNVEEVIHEVECGGKEVEIAITQYSSCTCQVIECDQK
ncbi:hypothetical protein HELRODRAFT_174077 [Helobdella robusta]|uniref:CTCK domain-containing protein n=1 Tax=Helobdella robusta TaxID=6412 RepID=T1F7K6_HELRO|nr:hypothetical protein HELRODRAFT_174077 [Helobdella robusta]ESO03178.1 hypothetical protein HELRODRAFT_174077 [Helobdella robusta]